MKKINITTAALLLSIATNGVTAAYPHRGDDALAAHFNEVVLPRNAALAMDPSFRGINHHEKVRGVQAPIHSTRLQTFARPSISVINTDTLAAVTEMLAAGFRNPAILNLANKTVPGGGVRSGSKAQEEDLCRSTTLYESLIDASQASKYPLQELEAIYSPKVWSHVDTGLGSFAAISMAGYRVTKGRVDPADYPGEDSFAQGMEEKISVILSTLISRGHTNIVLGALGCGAFAKNSRGIVIPHIPVDVARAFSAVLNSQYIDGIPYANHFERIVFAILENPQQEFLNPIFKDALRITPQTSTAVSTQTMSSMHAVAAAAAAATSNVTEFDTSITNLERIFKEHTGLSALFSGPRVTIEFKGQTAWRRPNNPWPVKVNSYSEKDGGWTINASFANGNNHTADIKITGHWQSLDREARAWLKKVTHQ